MNPSTVPSETPVESPALQERNSLGSVAVVLGTRPEAIKVAEIIQRLGSRALVVHTGQHYDAEMWSNVAEGLDLGTSVSLGLGAAPRGQQLGLAVARLDEALGEHQPAAVVVQGDTTTALAGGLAANARDIPLVHVEAGLRSFDRRMPEEHNRVLVDHIADLLCAPTDVAVEHLRAEGIPDERILLTGNTVVESVLRLLPDPAQRARIIGDLRLPEQFLLLTLHRPENADDPVVLRRVFDELKGSPLPVVFPAHPRTTSRLRAMGMEDLLEKVIVIPPVPPAEFLALSAEARLIVSDSGGVQEEVSVLKKRLIVVRRSTERPEVMGTFASLVPAGIGLRQEIERAMTEDPDALADIPTPFGDGTASAQIVEAIGTLIDGRR